MCKLYKLYWRLADTQRNAYVTFECERLYFESRGLVAWNCFLLQKQLSEKRCQSIGVTNTIIKDIRINTDKSLF